MRVSKKPSLTYEDHKIIGELLVILALPSALPVATGGIAHAMSIPIIGLAIGGLMFGRSSHATGKSRIVGARDKVLSYQKVRTFHDKIWHHAGRFSKARWSFLFDNRAFLVITALFISACAICFWTIIPIADTPPSVAVMLFGFSIVYRDIAIWAAAVVIGLIGIAINIGTLLFAIMMLLKWFHIIP